MGADCTAAWLGAFVITALSFVPAIMAPTETARSVAGFVARLSLPVSLAAALWSTLSALQLTPPPGGVFVSLAYPLLFAPVALSAWGVGLISRVAAERALGRRLPHVIALGLGLGAVVLMLAAR